MGLNSSRFLDFSPMAREVEEKRRGGKMEVGSKSGRDQARKGKYLKKVEPSHVLFRVSIHLRRNIRSE